MDEELLDRVHEAIESGSPRSALRLLRPLLGKEGSTDVHMLAGISLSQLGRAEEALTHFQRCVEMESSEAAHWYNLAACQVQLLGDSDGPRPCSLGEIYRNLQRSLELDPRGPTSREARRTLRVVRTAVTREIRGQKRDMDIDTWFELEEIFLEGFRALQQGDLSTAEEQFRQTTERAPRSHKAHGSLGLALLLQNRLDEAEGHLLRALELDPTYPPALINMQMLQRLREAGASRRRLEKLRETMLVAQF